MPFCRSKPSSHFALISVLLLHHVIPPQTCSRVNRETRCPVLFFVCDVISSDPADSIPGNVTEKQREDILRWTLFVCLRVCGCVCERERDRKRLKAVGGSQKTCSTQTALDSVSSKPTETHENRKHNIRFFGDDIYTLRPDPRLNYAKTHLTGHFQTVNHCKHATIITEGLKEE